MYKKVSICNGIQGLMILNKPKTNTVFMTVRQKSIVEGYIMVGDYRISRD